RHFCPIKVSRLRYRMLLSGGRVSSRRIGTRSAWTRWCSLSKSAAAGAEMPKILKGRSRPGRGADGASGGAVSAYSKQGGGGGGGSRHGAASSAASSGAG
ncbi:unnamed protein product, partial [Ectocarpus fasciculatus]